MMREVGRKTNNKATRDKWKWSQAELAVKSLMEANLDEAPLIPTGLSHLCDEKEESSRLGCIHDELDEPEQYMWRSNTIDICNIA